MTLLMVGLEPYRERYTTQLDGPNGWWDRNLKRAGVDFTRIQGLSTPMTLRTGAVIDPAQRTMHAFLQVEDLIERAIRGEITDKDTIYFSDFWHPGFEQLPYTFHQLGIKPKMYAFCHAQSVDEFDFTHPMRGWMRHFERGIASVLDGVFVSCPSMGWKLSQELPLNPGFIRACGHVWSTEEVRERMPVQYRSLRMDDTFGTYPRKNQVVFSSRWDKEKNPDFFLRMAQRVLADRHCPNDVKFVVCTSSPKLRSNNPKLLTLLDEMRSGFLSLFFEVRENLTKEEYYATLCESKVQFNCSDQDWVSYVLLEASAAGCYPIYPNFRSFPETFLGDFGKTYLYEHRNVEAAASKVLEVLNSKVPLWSPRAIEARAWIHRRFDSTWMRMLDVMGIPMGTETEGPWLKQMRDESGKDPFNAEDW
jgi:glycosyltransferase involved in cell wall biosynthesis